MNDRILVYHMGYLETVTTRRQFKQRVEWLETLLRELYAAANPTILDDEDTGVRLSPEWNERIKQALNENNGNH